MSYQPTKWSELLYVQRQPEHKDQFDTNWDLIFGKKDNKEQVVQEEFIEPNQNGK